LSMSFHIFVLFLFVALSLSHVEIFFTKLSAAFFPWCMLCKIMWRPYFMP
jgi:hypothetical protein